MTALRIERLDRRHAIEGFTCGREGLDRFFVRHALASQRANASRTYVGLADDAVIGFYTLVVGEIAHEDAAERLTRGLARHPVPVMVLARLAVRTDWQGKRIGAGLMKDAIVRTLQAADLAGIRAFVVHAKDDAAGSFYRHFGFAGSPTDPLHLFALIKDLRGAIRA